MSAEQQPALRGSWIGVLGMATMFSLTSCTNSGALGIGTTVVHYQSFRYMLGTCDYSMQVGIVDQRNMNVGNALVQGLADEQSGMCMFRADVDILAGAKRIWIDETSSLDSTTERFGPWDVQRATTSSVPQSAPGQMTLRTGMSEPSAMAEPDGAGEDQHAQDQVNGPAQQTETKVRVPDFRNYPTVDDVRDAVASAGLRMGFIRYVDSDLPHETVLSQSPNAGVMVDPGSRVNIQVSSGKVAVPDVLGKTEAQARASLLNAGFQPSVDYMFDSSQPMGVALSQTPEPDAKMQVGSVVSVMVNARESEN
ncbi:MAG: PASTA domain-containing protein [Actinomycetales bacterium]|nr:PASTA domain-containing protein [Actinomycetales bacterium]